MTFFDVKPNTNELAPIATDENTMEDYSYIFESEVPEIDFSDILAKKERIYIATTESFT